MYLFAILKFKDFNEWRLICSCLCFWFLRASANLLIAFDENICILFNFCLLSYCPPGTECLSDSPWQISYGRSAVIENSHPKGCSSPAGKPHEQTLSLAAMHCWRHAVRKDVRHCFNVQVLVKNYEEFSGCWLQIETMTTFNVNLVSLIIFIFLFFLSILKNECICPRIFLGKAAFVREFFSQIISLHFLHSLFHIFWFRFIQRNLP